MQLPKVILLCTMMCLASSAHITAQAPHPGRAEVVNLAELKEKIKRDNRDHPVASVRWAEAALRELAVRPNPESEIWFLTSLVDDLLVLSDYPKAEIYLDQGRKAAARSHGHRGRLLLEIRAAALLLHTGKPGEAKLLLDGLLPSMESFRSKNLQDQEIGKALGTGFRLKGTALQTIGQYSDAIGAYQKVQSIGEELGDRREQAIALNQMGTLYALLGRLEEAIASHLQAIQMAEALGDQALQAAFHLNLADTHRFKNNPEAQLKALNRALELARKAGNVSFEIAGMVNLADVYLQKRDYAAALKVSDAALKMPGISEDPDKVAVCQVNRGIALNRLGRNTEGLAAIQEGLRQVHTAQDKSQIAEITGNLAEEFAFAGDYRKAYQVEREFKALSDELKQTEDRKHIAEASAAFESDKKQIQIESLKREQRIQFRLVVLWIALSLLGFSVVGILLVGRKKMKKLNASLSDMNSHNLELIDQLKSALSEVRTLEGLIPICAHCKKIRDDEGYWSKMETYIQKRTEARFTHGMCPECYEQMVSEFDRLNPNET